MLIKSFNSQFNLEEFHFYMNEVRNQAICLLEVLIDCSINEFVESEFGDVLLIETDEQSYVFSGYKVDEYFEEGGLLKVILVK